MKNCLMLAAAGCLLLLAVETKAGTKVTVECLDDDDATAAFPFKTVPRPATNNLAASARFSIVDGEEDSNSGGMDKLHDGRLPDEADEPGENFFFNAGSDGGRLLVDLGKVADIHQVNTYSWHPGTRGPQVYKLYAADGKTANFNAAPKNGTAPDQCGWTLVADVNTRPKSGDGGGQYGVSIADPDGNLGEYRYLLFDISATEKDDDFGNTFFSEINVLDTNASQSAFAEVAPKDLIVNTADGKCTITINTAKAPQLKA
jgi:hypothetical protein